MLWSSDTVDYARRLRSVVEVSCLCMYGYTAINCVGYTALNYATENTGTFHTFTLPPHSQTLKPTIAMQFLQGHNKMLNELKHLALFLPSYTFQSHFSFLCTLVIHFTQQFRVQSRRMVVDRQQGLLLGLVCLHAPLQVIFKT